MTTVHFRRDEHAEPGLNMGTARVELEGKHMHHLVPHGQDSPRVAAVTQGRGVRLLGVMLVGNAILRSGEGREKAQYVRPTIY